jgi:hypothetical protein
MLEVLDPRKTTKPTAACLRTLGGVAMLHLVLTLKMRATGVVEASSQSGMMGITASWTTETGPAKIGVDGINGPAPVASCKSKALGFYDLGGNVPEWIPA